MGRKMLHLAFIVLTVVSIVSGAELANAQAYPTKPIQLVAAGSPSGSVDIVARMIEQTLTAEKMLDKPFVLSNKAAGGGNQATSFMVEQKGNGDILEVNNIRLVMNQLLGTIEYGLKDQMPIARLTTEFSVWTVRTDSKYKSALEVLADLKKDPKSVVFGVTSMQSNNYFHILMATKQYGVDYKAMQVVALPAGGELLSQLLGGHIPIAVSQLSEVVAQVQAGKLRVLCVSSPSKLDKLPGVPVWKDLGLDVVIYQWMGTYGVPNMPKVAYDYWIKKLTAMVKTKTWKDLRNKYDLEDAFLAGEPFRKSIEGEESTYAELIGSMGMLKKK
jgi:putative tricarboxylic transport membrane protein